MVAEYYIWKWADNDLPGQPAEIVHQLAGANLPPALQPFRIWEVQPRLVKVLKRHQLDFSEVYIDPYTETAGTTRFIRLRCPVVSPTALRTDLLWAVWEAKLTVYQATAQRLLGLPKLNVVEFPGDWQYLDIEVADIAGLLHELASERDLAALACYDRDGNMFQVWCYRRRFAVEWQILPDRDFKWHRIWVAGRRGVPARPTRLGTVETSLELFTPELLDFADAYGLWRSFLTSSCRPPQYHWRDVTRQLDRPGQPRRYRHREQENQPPSSVEKFFGQN